MLSFGHYNFNHQGQHSIPFNSQFQHGRASYPQGSLDHHDQQSVRVPATNVSNLPLTPPGSPDDEESPLVICDSPQKTPQKQPPMTAGECANMDTSAINAASCNAQGANSSFSCAVNAAASTRSDLDASQSASLANFFYNSGTFARPPSAYSTISTGRRSRNEKKPMPDAMKDEKYFERRRRNNAAAKKSRDARKSREDEIAARAAFLEKDNAVLRAQLATLREEARNLQFLLLQKQGRQLSTLADSSMSSFTTA